jgi:hypothetical protein
VSYQYVEAEYMRADEYDEFISDPSAFWLRRQLPRVFGAPEPLQGLGSLGDLLEIASAAPSLAYFGRPDVQQMLLRLMAAGAAACKHGGQGRAPGGQCLRHRFVPTAPASRG